MRSVLVMVTSIMLCPAKFCRILSKFLANFICRWQFTLKPRLFAQRYQTVPSGTKRPSAAGHLSQLHGLRVGVRQFE